MVKRLTAFLAAAVLTLSLVGVASSAPDRDTLVIGIHQDALTLDPANHRHRETETIIRNMMDGFVTRTPDMKVVNELAESMRPVDDTTWEIKLRRGVTFHNGEPFTAEDAAFTVNRLVKEGAMGGQTSPRKGLLGPVTGAEVVDEYTILVKMEKPWPVFLAMLPFQEVVPKDYILKVGDRRFAEQPIGTGPFKFVEWVKGSRIVMERYDGYYGGSPDIPPVGPARVKRVIFEVIPEDAARLAALRAGQIDIMTQVPPHAVPGIQKDPSLEVLTCNGTRSYFMAFNLKTPPFNDKRVRQALNYAIDVQMVIDAVLNGMAVRTPTVLSPEAFAFDRNLAAYPHDLAKAKRLLSEAGYPNGFEFELDTLNYRKEVAEAYAMLLEPLGIKVKVRVWGEWGALREQILAGKRTAWLTDWGNGSLDPSDILEPLFASGGRGNYGGYSNPRVDELLKAADSTNDQTFRKQAYEEIQAIIREEAPMVFEYVGKDIYAINKRVKNFVPSPDSKLNMHDVYKER